MHLLLSSCALVGSRRRTLHGAKSCRFLRPGEASRVLRALVLLHGPRDVTCLVCVVSGHRRLSPTLVLAGTESSCSALVVPIRCTPLQSPLPPGLAVALACQSLRVSDVPACCLCFSGINCLWYIVPRPSKSIHAVHCCVMSPCSRGEHLLRSR